MHRLVFEEQQSPPMTATVVVQWQWYSNGIAESRFVVKHRVPTSHAVDSIPDRPFPPSHVHVSDTMCYDARQSNVQQHGVPVSRLVSVLSRQRAACRERPIEEWQWSEETRQPTAARWQSLYCQDFEATIDQQQPNSQRCMTRSVSDDGTN
jgi:hypothetical protein